MKQTIAHSVAFSSGGPDLRSIWTYIETTVGGKIKTKKGVATRVWVGPYAKRVQAARVRTRIERVTGEKGLITPYP